MVERVARALAVMRKVQKKLPLEDMAVSSALKVARETGQMKEIRAQFPEAKNNKEAMVAFQKLAKEQTNVTAQEEITDDRPLVGVAQLPVEEEQGGLDIKTTQRNAKKIMSMFPGSTVSYDEQSGGYQVTSDEKYEGSYDSSPQAVLSQFAKVMEDGAREQKNRILATEVETGKELRLNSVEITKLGALIDQASNDPSRGTVKKSINQFRTGQAFLHDIGISLENKTAFTAQQEVALAALDAKIVEAEKAAASGEEATGEEATGEEAAPKQYVNHSGGAKGADHQWGVAGEKYGVTSNHYYKDKTPFGNKQITLEEYDEGVVKAKQAAAALGRNWSPKPYIQGLLARNWQQVKNADEVFAIGSLNGKQVAGGTGYAVEMAKAEKKPIHVFDQKTEGWVAWDYPTGDWKKTGVPTLTENFAGIGTRGLEESGRNAIDQVYSKAFGGYVGANIAPVHKAASKLPSIVRNLIQKFRWLSADSPLLGQATYDLLSIDLSRDLINKKELGFEGQELVDVVVAHEAGHVIDKAYDIRFSRGLPVVVFGAMQRMYHNDKGNPLHKWVDLVFGKDTEGHPMYEKASWPEELFAQIYALYTHYPQLLKKELPDAYNYVESVHDILLKEQPTNPAAKGQNRERAAEGARKSSGKSEKDKGREELKKLKQQRDAILAKPGVTRGVTPDHAVHGSGIKLKREKTLGRGWQSDADKPPGTDPHDVVEVVGRHDDAPGSNKDLSQIYDEAYKVVESDAENTSKINETDEIAAGRSSGRVKASPEVNTAPVKSEQSDRAKVAGLKATREKIKAQEAELDALRTKYKAAKTLGEKRKLKLEAEQLKTEIEASKRREKSSLSAEQEESDRRSAKILFGAAAENRAFGKIPQRFMNLTKSLFNELGIKTKVVVVDKAGAAELLKQNLPAQWRKNLENVLNDRPSGRLMVSNSSNPDERFAMIYLDTSKPMAKQQRVFMHELGHIVQLSKLDQMPAEIQAEMSNAWKQSRSQEEFEEWFANQLLKWAVRREAPKTILDKWFAEFAKVLRRVFRKFGRADDTYSDFMDAMVGVSRDKRHFERPASGVYRRHFMEALSDTVDSNFLAPQGKEFYNFPSTSPWTLSTKKKASQLLDGVKEVISPIHQVALQSISSYLRSVGLNDLKNHFHHEPDVRAEMKDTAPTIEQESRVHFGQFEREIDHVMEKIPEKERPWHLLANHKDSEYIQAVSDLLTESSTPNELAKRTRAYFEKLADYLEQNNVKFKRRQNYFPILLDQARWDADRDVIIKIAMEKLGKTEAQASSLHLRVSLDPSSEGMLSGKYDPMSAGSFDHGKSRSFGPKEHEAFQDYLDTDIASVIKNYTHTAVKHVIVVRHFNRKRTLNEKGFMDPLHDLKKDLEAKLLAGEISKDTYHRVLTKVLPALFGQLGASMSPTLRKFGTAIVLYQNIRLLPLATLASLVDPVGVIYRAGTLKGKWGNVSDAIKMMSNEEGKLALRTLGFIRDDLTEAITNDSSHTQFYSPKMKAVNEKFFKWIGLNYWTNLSRAFGLSAGKQFILDAHRSGDSRALAELGLTAEDVSDWDKGGQNLGLGNDVNEKVLYALHKFTDEAILRPSAAQKPVWMSDAYWMLVSHLKSFIFAYYETILKRIWSQVKAGDFKDPAKLLPVIAFAGLAIGVSMAAYELRRQLTHLGDVPVYADKDALGYLSEAVQRSGMLGPMQFFIDSMEAEGRGNMALLSLLGPTASQFEMLVNKDLSYSLGRSLPGVSAVPALREVAFGR